MPFTYMGALVDWRWADAQLEKLHPDQRRPKESKIQHLMEDGQDDRWEWNPTPITYDESGYIIDGQNRLLAISRAKLENIKVVLCFHAPKESLKVIDTGFSRTVADIARMSKVNITNSQVFTTARAMVLTPFENRKTISSQKTIDAAQAYEMGLSFAFGHIRGHQCPFPAAGVRTVVARDYFARHKELKRLEEFCEVMETGLINSKVKDASAILLRNWLIQVLRTTIKGTAVHVKRPGKMLIYKYTEYVLYHFLKNERIVKLDEAEIELFPIPPLTLE
jgi:hypothetical protein